MKQKRLKLLISIVLTTILSATLLCGCETGSASVRISDYADVYLTTGTMSKLLARQTSAKFEQYLDEYESEGVVISVNANKKGQEFYGYGASLTHSSAYLLNQKGAETAANQILQETYGESGARFGLVRLPIGASDYIEGEKYFTCCDLEDNSLTDMSLEHFTIEKDANIIAVMKKILQINPDVKVLATPWSAPAWMKANKSLLGGTLEEGFSEVYADYLVKYIESYKNEGIEIDYLSLVNEPLITNINYPHMSLDEYQALEIGKSVNEKLAAKGLNVKLLGWEHNVDEMAYDYLDTIFNNTDTAMNDVFAGVALHGYAQGEDYGVPQGCEIIKGTYPNKEIFLTEITEHTGSNDFANNLAYAARYNTVDPINYGLNGSMFWNLVLRSDGSPTPHNHGNECYGVMDLDLVDGEYTYYKHSAYYAMAHVGKFAYAIDGKYPVMAETISSNDSQILACSLVRADGTLVVTAVNVSDQLSEKVYVVIGGQCVSVELTPQSVVTFVC